MALKATIYKANLSLSDLDKNHFADYSLTLALHPSETQERMMIRLLAFAMFASETLQFGKGISTEDEAAVWDIDYSGVIKRWIEVGLPDETRLKKASSKSDKLVLFTYGRGVDVWWKQNAHALERLPNLDVYQISIDDCQTLTRLADRNMKLEWTIQEGVVYLGQDQVQPTALWVRD